MKNKNGNTKLKKEKRRNNRKLKQKNKNAKKNENSSASFYEEMMHISEQMSSSTFGYFYTKNNLKDKLSGKDKEELIRFFAGICFDPELHSTSAIIESLIPPILLMDLGDEPINKELCSDLFDMAGSSGISTLPDPAEDIMVGAIQTEIGTFRILEGLWESCGFYCQLFINVVEKMPQGEPFDSLRNSIYTLLSISDLAVERSGLTRYEMGNDEPISNLNLDAIDMNKVMSICNFTKEDFALLQIEENDLNPFVLSQDEIKNLFNECLGESSLEKKPLIRNGSGSITLALPTAVGYSIRNYIIYNCIKLGMQKNLENFYKKSFVDYFRKKRIFGHLANVPFDIVQFNDQRISGAEAVVKIDQGRYLHLIMYFDDFANGALGVNSLSPNAHAVSSDVSKAILNLQQEACKEQGFVRGLSLIILCGWGRAMAPDLDEKIDRQEWDIEFISAPDLDTFNRIPEMSPLIFWRMIEAKRIVREAGVRTHNINGLLNLYSWAKSNNNDIVPHEDLPEEISSGSQFFMMIQLNSYLKTRWETKFNEDLHTVRSPLNGMVLVTRYIPAVYFKEDALKPIYVSVTDLSSERLVSLVKGEFSYWWCQPLVKEGQDRDFIYKLWEAISGWVLRLDISLFKFLSCRNDKQIILNFETEDLVLPKEVKDLPTQENLKKLIEVKFISEENLTIQIVLKQGYLAGFHQHENHAESIIVQALLTALMKNLSYLADNASMEREIFDAVVSNQFGKHIHLYRVDNFIDYVRPSLPEPLRQDAFDQANLKIGLGWIDDINTGIQSEISGVKECTEYLGKLTLSLRLKIKETLCKWNRSELISFLLSQHEAIESNSIHWQSTFTAVLNLHKDREDVYAVVTERVSSNNAMLSGIRILLEMAICEADDSSSTLPNHLDASRLIMLANSIFEYGNLSDAIHFEMVEAKIRITSLGDVHFNHGFHDLVVAPYGRHVQSKLIDSTAKKYAKRFDAIDASENVDVALDAEFESAWMAEYGIDIDEVIKIMDLFEDIGINRKKAVYEIGESEIISQSEASGIDSEQIFKFLSGFTLPSRGRWDQLPQGFKVADISPWRFRRRLSSVTKPVFKIDQYIISPNLIRRGVAYLLSNAYDGSLDGAFFNSKEMKSWIGGARDKKGHEFNNQTKIRFEELGLKAESDVRVSKILQRKTEKDFGDVDTLAWDAEKGIVYLVECKDLEFSKTPGEIAKQIYEFRGEVRRDGKDDRLKKHLERCNILIEHRETLKKYLKLSVLNDVQIVLLFKQSVPIPYHSPINQLPIKIVFFNDLNSLLE